MADLEEKVRAALAELDVPAIVEQRMFGGIGYLVRGNMACGVHKGRLIVRVGPGAYARALARPHVGEFDITGRAMKGWVMVEPEGCASEDAVCEWVKQGIEFALTLPAK